MWVGFWPDPERGVPNKALSERSIIKRIARKYSYYYLLHLFYPSPPPPYPCYMLIYTKIYKGTFDLHILIFFTLYILNTMNSCIRFEDGYQIIRLCQHELCCILLFPLKNALTSKNPLDSKKAPWIYFLQRGWWASGGNFAPLYIFQ